MENYWDFDPKGHKVYGEHLRAEFYVWQPFELLNYTACLIGLAVLENKRAQLVGRYFDSLKLPTYTCHINGSFSLSGRRLPYADIVSCVV
jgi:hypothetical protein